MGYCRKKIYGDFSELKIVVIYNNHLSANLIRTADAMINKYGGEVIVFCENKKNAKNANQIEKISKTSIFYLEKNKLINMNLSEEFDEKHIPNINHLDKLKKYLRHIYIFYWFFELKIYTRIEFVKKLILESFNISKPDLILSYSDRNNDYIESSILYSAKKLKIPIVIPFVAQFDKDAALNYRLNKANSDRHQLNPFWPPSFYKLYSFFNLKKTLYKNYFFQTPYVMNAHKRSQTLSKNPWWVGNGLNDFVLVENDFNKKKYIENGVEEKKIRILGHSIYSDVYDSYLNKATVKKQIYKKYFLDEDKEVILFSLPQYFEQGYLSWNEHNDTIKRIINFIKKTDKNFLVSLHPRQEIKNYNYLNENLNLKIIDESLSAILSGVDIFVASDSSTLNWSVLCGIKTINFYRFKPNLHSHLKSVIHIDVDSNDLNFEEIITKKNNYEDDWKLLSRDKVFNNNYYKRIFELLK